MIIRSVGHWFVRKYVENEDGNHDSGCKVFPAQIPEFSRSSSGHLFNSVAEAISTEKPADGNGLKEANPEQRKARTRVEIHQLEQIHSALCIGKKERGGCFDIN